MPRSTVVQLLGSTGAFIAFKSMFIAGKAASPAFQGGLVIGATPVSSFGSIKTFVWSGIDWSLYYVVERVGVIVLTAALVVLAAWVFDRFDQAVESSRKLQGKAANGAIGPLEEQPITALPVVTVSAATLTKAHHSSLAPAFVRMVAAELRVMLKGRPWWWYLVAVGLIGAGLFTSLEQARVLVLPLAWLWPLALWSGLGNRDVQHRTQALLLSAPSPIGCQLFAGWAAGVLVALLVGSGVAVRMLLGGELGPFAAYLVAAVFIPAFALALGVWTGSSKTFEVLYMILWYLGPMNRNPAVDFVGATDAALEAMIPLYYLIFAILLIALAVLGRARQLRFA